MRTTTLPLAAALLAFAFVATTAPAQTTAAVKAPDMSSTGPAAAKPGTFDDIVKQIKNPTDWLSWGGDIRVRNEYYNNIVSLSSASAISEQDVVRYRGRVWTSLTPVTNVTFNSRVTAEPWLSIKPSFTTADTGNSGMEWRYGIVDNLNMKLNNMFNLPLTLIAGRQDIMLGDYYDWWLVSDGTPGDGSKTFFLDSIRLSGEAKGIKTKFDLIYIYQNAKPDGMLPIIGSSSYVHPDLNVRTDYQLTEQNEQGVVAYVSNTSIKNTQLDGYFIYKRDDRQTFERLGADRVYGDNANIYTLGGKVTGTPEEHWQYSAEGAYQLGNKQDTILGTFADRDIEAYAGKGKLTYLFKDQFNCQLALNGEYLSGDDPKTTGHDEMFDILWGRWPRWSELYIYSYIEETGGKIAQMNNLIRFGPSWTCTPIKGLTASVMYNALFAPEDTPTRDITGTSSTNPEEFSKDGNFRGHYLQAVLKHKFNDHVSAHLWGEWIWEGNYYAQRNLMTFLRAEVMFTF
jgi:hypothetical protein